METLKEAKQVLRENWKKGIDCPCCGQFVHLTRVSFHSSMAKVLILLYKYGAKYQNAEGYIHIENFLVEQGSKIKGVHSKLELWGMLERQPNTDDPTKKHSGYWKLTKKGIDFVEELITVPYATFTYNKKQYGFDNAKQIGLREALGTKFNYGEILGNF